MKSLLAIISLLLAFSLVGGEMFPCSAEGGPAATGGTPSPAAEKPAASHEKERFSGTVEIYVTDWCGYCRRAQSYMKGKGIPYVAYDIEKDAAAMQRYKEMGGHGVPLIIIGSNRMSGFSQGTLEHYLDISR
ncbi:MAG TPA: glutaredoxin domain-containing protein [Dongiaceae bacterium]|nr:glutaredoxin domain-containing protein [Dongiaceae bacterium]